MRCRLTSRAVGLPRPAGWRVPPKFTRSSPQNHGLPESVTPAKARHRARLAEKCYTCSTVQRANCLRVQNLSPCAETLSPWACPASLCAAGVSPCGRGGDGQCRSISRSFEKRLRRAWQGADARLADRSGVGKCRLASGVSRHRAQSGESGNRGAASGFCPRPLPWPVRD